MSQKSGKRSKKEAAAGAVFKAPDSTKTKDETTKNLETAIDTVSSGNADENTKKNLKEEKSCVESTSEIESVSPKRGMQTRSCSNSPYTKNVESTNGIKDDQIVKSEVVEVKEVIVTKEAAVEDNETSKDNNRNSSLNSETTVEDNVMFKDDNLNPSINFVETDVIVLDKDEEEPIPELQFDETDIEVESEGANSRCKTRRSESRNTSTPKTPKMIDLEEFESDELLQNRSGSITPKVSPVEIAVHTETPEALVNLNDTSYACNSVSIDNISTRAIVGSDGTLQDSKIFDENSFLSVSKGSFVDTVKGLSGRRSIHSLSTYTTNHGDLKKNILKKISFESKGDVYADYESVQRISIRPKRKSRSFSPTERKRFKQEQSGLLSYFPNFKSTKTVSSPKLISVETKIAFDDDNEDFDKIKLENSSIHDKEKKRCSIM
ncbi:hypothetical protein FQA39_LY01312 [Lamprigera yunnana]|nr:hypothetical protein FQA39_LY01312 [Lamprigera yunnana]